MNDMTPRHSTVTVLETPDNQSGPSLKARRIDNAARQRMQRVAGVVGRTVRARWLHALALAVALVLTGGSTLGMARNEAVNVAIDGGSTWENWSLIGNSQDPGTFSRGSRRSDFDLYATSFQVSGQELATATVGNTELSSLVYSPHWQVGDLVVAVGAELRSGQRGIGEAYLKVDRNGTGSFKASTTPVTKASNGSCSGDLNIGSGGFQVIFQAPEPHRMGWLKSWKMAAAQIQSSEVAKAATRYPFLLFPASSAAYLPVDLTSFWGSDDLETGFVAAVPFRAYGQGNSSEWTSMQWLINASAFDRAVGYSAPFQSFRPGWGFCVGFQTTAGFTDVVGLNLPLEGVEP